MSFRGSVDRAPIGGHGFDCCWRLRFFLCPTLVSYWSILPVTFHYWAFKFAIFIHLSKALFFCKSRILAPFVFKIKMWQVLRTSCWVLLRVSLRSTEQFQHLIFQLGFCNAVVIGSGIFHFKLKFIFLSTRLFPAHFAITSLAMFALLWSLCIKI